MNDYLIANDIDSLAISVESVYKTYKLYNDAKYRLYEALHPLRKKFHHEYFALRNVTFDVRKGESVGIIGGNGSGKSTLLQLIAGVLSPTNGKIVVNGRLASILELGIGFSPDLTGRENVYMYGLMMGMTNDQMRDRFEEIERFASIGEFIDQPLKTYSSGMIVRLGFSVSLCVDPDVLIIDEALSVGDVAFQFKCLERLDKVVRSGVTLLFVSHDMSTIKSFCSRVIYLKNGELVANGEPRLIVEQYIRDMRAKQFDELYGKKIAFTDKASIANGSSVAFGTNQGRITKAYFIKNGGQMAAFDNSEDISAEIHVEYDESLNHPSLSISVHESKMILLYSSYCNIKKSKNNCGKYYAVIRFQLKNILIKGKYFITVKLDERPSHNVFMPIDKQVGILIFEVFSDRNECEGIIEMGATFIQET